MQEFQEKSEFINLDYTFQIAGGTASDPYQAQQAISSGQMPEIHFIPLRKLFLNSEGKKWFFSILIHSVLDKGLF